jgi:hypothetical protein
MNAFFGVAIFTAIYYSIFIDGTFFKHYFVFLALYTIFFNYLSINKKEVTKRKNMTVTGWDGKFILMR